MEPTRCHCRPPLNQWSSPCNRVLGAVEFLLSLRYQDKITIDSTPPPLCTDHNEIFIVFRVRFGGGSLRLRPSKHPFCAQASTLLAVEKAFKMADHVEAEAPHNTFDVRPFSREIACLRGSLGTMTVRCAADNPAMTDDLPAAETA